jgi:hypothetical protein
VAYVDPSRSIAVSEVGGFWDYILLERQSDVINAFFRLAVFDIFESWGLLN